MKNNLSSQIVLSRVPSRLYKPTDKIEASRLTRREKIQTTIVENADEGSALVASMITERVKKASSSFTVALSTGKSLVDIRRALAPATQQVRFLDWQDGMLPQEEQTIDLLVIGLGSVGEVGGQGIRTMLRAKEVILVAWGEHKAEALREAVEGEVKDSCPASKLQFHEHAQIVCDLNAAECLTRIQRPWLVTTCDWDDQLTRRAIVWLCRQAGKPILKLTNQDYKNYGLDELITIYGSAYDCNIKIFNDLQHTITGWPGGKPNADDTDRPERATPYPKDILIFSPHPDDDVISMGGTFQRLIKQKHNVHIAYETSGCIAVDDSNLQYFLDFMNGYDKALGLKGEKAIGREGEKLTLADFSFRQILDLKALIRRGEATAADRYMGLKEDHVHFLNLPFYETGTIKKNDLSQADVDIVKQLLLEIKPQEMFVAGDLADPHGTHKVCLDAVLAAIDELKDSEEWLHNCRVWMYRGAWMEWEPDLIEMVVPMSPEELRHKRNTILRHQSQMESAPFLGDDERLFWQRAEDRNHATAEMYAQLGLANYEAMEAFVQYRFQKDLTLQNIVSQFAIPNQVGEPKPLVRGLINDSYVLPALEPGQKSYFLQRINHRIFTNVEGLQKNIQKVTEHIRKKLQAAGATDIDRRVLKLIPTKDGQLFYMTSTGEYWRVYALIDHAQSQEKVTPESAYLAGQAFGQFQSQLSDLPFNELCESIPNFHNIEFRLQQLDEAIAEDKAGRLSKCDDIVARINARRDDMCLAERLFREGKLPKHINHCDTKVNNMMFDEQGNPLCIVDLDTVMPGFVLSDFGDFMRTAANTGEEDDKNLDHIHVNMPIFEAYTKGYLEQATFLTDLEKELLPFGCRLLSYMQAVRFFTDYLNGDTYYKTQYPEHNYIRTLAQLRLLEEQEQSASEMERIIQKFA